MKQTVVNINGTKLTELTGPGSAHYALVKAVNPKTGQKRFFIDRINKVRAALEGWHCYSI